MNLVPARNHSDAPNDAPLRGTLGAPPRTRSGRAGASWTAWLALGVLTFALISTAAPLAQGDASTSGSVHPWQWAYGGTGGFTYAMSGSNLTGGGGGMFMDMHAYATVEDIITVANTSATTFEVEVQRAFVGAFYVEMNITMAGGGGFGNSSGGNILENVSFAGWGVETLFANFTTAATVTQGGASLPALGLESTGVISRGNATMNSTTEMPMANGLGGSSTIEETMFVSATEGGFGQLSFSPALGLLPWNTNITLGEPWSATSQFTGQGSGTMPYHSYVDSGMPGVAPQAATGTAPLTVPSSGSVTATGEVALLLDFLDGTASLALSMGITTSAPLEDLEGIILLPQGFDLFGSSGLNPGGNANATGSESASTSQVDFPKSDNAPAPDGSQTNFGGQAQESSSSSSSITASPALGSVRSIMTASSSAATHMSKSQSQPQTPAQAQRNAQATGVTLSSPSSDLGSGGSSNGNGPGGIGGLLGSPFFLGLIVAAVAAASVALLVITRGRKRAAGHPPAPRAVWPPPSVTPPAGPAPYAGGGGGPVSPGGSPRTDPSTPPTYGNRAMAPAPTTYPPENYIFQGFPRGPCGVPGAYSMATPSRGGALSYGPVPVPVPGGPRTPPRTPEPARPSSVDFADAAEFETPQGATSRTPRPRGAAWQRYPAHLGTRRKPL